MNRFNRLAPFIAKMIIDENPRRILEISDFEIGSKYGRLLKSVQAYNGIFDGVIDRITLAKQAFSDNSVYTAAYGEDKLYDLKNCEYDVILIIDLLEWLEPETAKKLFEELQYRVTKQILIITPLYSGEQYRKYHPITFLGFDFCYSLLDTRDEKVQLYSIFPKKNYTALCCDKTSVKGLVRKLKVAFIIPHHNITGGMKALLQQIKQLTKKGHTVNVYYKAENIDCAIPAWSGLTKDDYAQQTVVPPDSHFRDYLRGNDIIMLGWILQIPEFVYTGIPVVLWEQGFESVFGDYGCALNSMSKERYMLHIFYRMPVHLLAVSEAIRTVMKGVYNRDAHIFPVGIDTEIYYPVAKNNIVPIILLTGNPTLAFKGFKFAFDVLTQAYSKGLRFNVTWASQVYTPLEETNFPLEFIVNPSQEELSEIYRSSDIYLSTSLYESYSLPPLEAMASGTAVISTDNGGIQTYAVDGKNCILCRQGDLNAMVNALSTLITDPKERQRLALAGIETAHEHSAEKTIEILENILSVIVHTENGSPNV